MPFLHAKLGLNEQLSGSIASILPTISPLLNAVWGIAMGSSVLITGSSLTSAMIIFLVILVETGSSFEFVPDAVTTNVNSLPGLSSLPLYRASKTRSSFAVMSPYSSMSKYSVAFV